MPNPTIEMVAVEKLIPYINNARTHSPEQVSQIAASIKEFGWTNPVLVDGDNVLIAGHGRLQAARLLEMDKIPAIRLDKLTENQRKALIIADNKLALNAGWDVNILKLELDDLQGADFDMDIVGFSDSELKGFFGEDDEEIPDEPNDTSRNLIMVELSSERECETLFTELQDRGFECKIMS